MKATKIESAASRAAEKATEKARIDAICRRITVEREILQLIKIGQHERFRAGDLEPAIDAALEAVAVWH